MKIAAAMIEFIAEFFYYIAESYRRSHFRINHLIVYPITFLYSDILLKILAHTQAHVAYMLVFDIGIMCLATGLTSVFSKTVNRILTIIVLTANGIYFGIECSLRQLDAIYEDIIPLFQNEEILDVFLEALPLVLLFLIPTFLYLLLGADHLPAVRRQPVFCALMLAAFLVFTFMGSVVGAHGRYAPYYKSIDSFNESTEVFGLYTSTRLELKWRFLGSGPTYVQVRAASNTPETDIGAKEAAAAGDETDPAEQTADGEELTEEELAQNSGSDSVNEEISDSESYGEETSSEESDVETAAEEESSADNVPAEENTGGDSAAG